MTHVSPKPHAMTIPIQIQALNEKKKILKDQSKKTSHFIGQAKKENSSIDELKVIMLEYSRQLKLIDDEMKSLKNPIVQLKETSSLSTTNVFNLDSYNSKETPRYPILPAYIESDISIDIYKGTTEAWNNYAAQHAAGTIYYRYEWQQILRQCYSLSSYYFAAHCNDKIVGILPITRHTSWLFGDYMVSMPWYGRGGPIADTPEIEDQLIQVAADFASKEAVDHIEFREEVPRKSLPSKTHKVNMVLDLPDTQEQLWHSFTSKLRAQIKRPQREKTSFLIGGEELIHDFYKVYARNMRDLGSPPHCKQFIVQIMRNFTSESRLAIVYLDHKPVSAGLLLSKENTIEIPLASTIKEVNHLSMNMLLYWNILSYAIENSYHYFDFGRSSVNAGTYRFKRQWGAKPKTLHWNYWIEDRGIIPSINPTNPKYRVVIWFWKHLPIGLANFIGTRLIRYIS